MIFFWPFILSFSFSLVLIPVVSWLAKKYKLVDDPKKHHHPAILHTKIVPRAGGLPIFLAFLAAVFLLIPVSKQILGIILGGGVLIFVGTIDDRRELGKSWKFLAQILAALIVVLAGVGITFITNPFHILGFLNLGGAEVIRLDGLRVAFDFLGKHSVLVWADLFAVFWIVWVINMVNFSAGVDGQMPGVIFIAQLVIFAASLRFFGTDANQLAVAQLALCGAGATLGFLIFNFYPAKIFPGDSGSYFLGFLVAVLAILSGAKVGTAILVMAVPLTDGVFTVLRRVASGKSPFLGDRKHLHHLLLALGWGQRRVALFYWFLCAILGAAAVILPSVQKLFAGVIVAVFVIGGLLWLNLNLPTKVQK